MIYEQGNQDYQFTMFACDVDEKLFSHMRPNWNDTMEAIWGLESQ